MTKPFRMLLSKSQATKFKSPSRYYSNEQVETEETAYEPYLHTGSDRDSTTRPLISSSGKNRPFGRKTGLRRFCVTCAILSAAISLAILGVSIDVIVALEKSKTARLLWSHNMMLRAWPLTGAPAVPTYVTVSAASATALLNISLLLAVTFGVRI